MVLPEKEPRGTRIANYAILALLFIGAIVFTLSNGGGGFSHFAFGDHSIILTDSQGTPTQIRYDEMLSIELVETPQYGNPVTGSTVNHIREGLWESKMFGQYIASAEERVSNCIFLQTAGGAYVFNAEAAQTTRELYDTICLRIAEDTVS